MLENEETQENVVMEEKFPIKFFFVLLGGEKIFF